MSDTYEQYLCPNCNSYHHRITPEAQARAQARYQKQVKKARALPKDVILKIIALRKGPDGLDSGLVAYICGVPLQTVSHVDYKDVVGRETWIGVQPKAITDEDRAMAQARDSTIYLNWRRGAPIRDIAEELDVPPGFVENTVDSRERDALRIVTSTLRERLRGQQPEQVDWDQVTQFIRAHHRKDAPHMTAETFGVRTNVHLSNKHPHSTLMWELQRLRQDLGRSSSPNGWLSSPNDQYYQGF